MILKRVTLKVFVFLCLSTAAAIRANAAIVKPLDEMQVIEAPISQEGLTRIKVEQDRILHVFGNSGEYVLETDEEQGQIFIRPLSVDLSRPISLTLTTELGHTQDLRLFPKEKAPETLIFKIDHEITQELEKEKRAHAPLFREEVEDLIQACQEDRIPLGYKEIRLNLTTLHEPYFLERELQGEHLRGLTYRVQNNTKESLVLSESEWSKSLPINPNAIIAILMAKKTLKPGEGVNVYVVARTH